MSSNQLKTHDPSSVRDQATHLKVSSLDGPIPFLYKHNEPPESTIFLPSSLARTNAPTLDTLAFALRLLVVQLEAPPNLTLREETRIREARKGDVFAHAYAPSSGRMRELNDRSDVEVEVDEHESLNPAVERLGRRSRLRNLY